MDSQTLAEIDEELDSSEVAALRFLCRDVLNRKRLETVKDGKDLFLRLEEKGLLENEHFLSELLNTIGRVDLLRRLQTDNSQSECCCPQTDATCLLSDYRVMLYQIHENITQENLKKMKFLLIGKLGGGPLESCATALDVLAEMERKDLLSDEKLDELERILTKCDLQLAARINRHQTERQNNLSPTLLESSSQPVSGVSSHFSLDDQRNQNSPRQLQHSLSVAETQPGIGGPFTYEEGRSMTSDSEPIAAPSPCQSDESYTLSHNPHGTCLVISNKVFWGGDLTDRPGTEEDEKALQRVFTSLGFEVDVHADKRAYEIRSMLQNLARKNHERADALVVCVLSHGDRGCVFGSDGEMVTLCEITQPFDAGHAPTLAGKPKLFFIQACQGNSYQRGALPCLGPRQVEEEGNHHHSWEADMSAIAGESVPWAADVLVGMATVEECKSFRHTTRGSVFIQELCRQLERAADSQEDIHTLMIRVNREVSRGEYKNHKQMPELKSTLTKKLFLTFI